MGRWSRHLAPRFVDFEGVTSGTQGLDGAGNLALRSCADSEHWSGRRCALNGCSRKAACFGRRSGQGRPQPMFFEWSGRRTVTSYARESISGVLQPAGSSVPHFTAAKNSARGFVFG